MILIVIFSVTFIPVNGQHEILLDLSHDDSTDCFPENGLPRACLSVRDCPTVDIYRQPIICGWEDHRIPRVCCPQSSIDISTTKSAKVVSHPLSLVECGDASLDFVENVDPYVVEQSDPHRIDMEVDKAIRRGLNVTDIEYGFMGNIVHAIIHNGTHNRTEEFHPVLSAVGGEPASPLVSSYMALLGEGEIRGAEPPNWFCGGVILNDDWIITAAHCLEYKIPDVVRIGEYDYSDPEERGVVDREVLEYHLHPEYASGVAYHDLALLRLKYPIPFVVKSYSQAICLPWGQETGKDLTGAMLTLTGWGALRFGGHGSPVLQEVNVTAFPSEVCHSSYSTLNVFAEFPEGISDETTLCAGHPEGGKDACKGDSGGPLVYLSSEDKLTLAGIVSKGHGCGDEDFPGIYVPVNKPRYLQWIKDVAFKDGLRP